MILEEDSLLNFRYNTISQILSVSWPDLTGTPLPEIENSIQKLARNIKNFDVRKMMVDLRSGFPGMEEEDYQKVVENYHRVLADTHLEKVARIIPEKPAWEYFVIQFTREMKKKFNLQFEVRFFTKKAEAMEWLLEP